MAADTGEFVGKSNVHSSERVLDDLRHFGRTDVRNHDFTLAEAGVAGLDLLPYRLVIGTNRTVVMQEFIDHIARDDALGSMDQVHLLAALGNNRTDGLVDGPRRDGGLDYHRRSLRTNRQHLLHRRYHIARVHFLGELVIRSRDGNNVHVRLLVLRRKLDSALNSSCKQLIQTIFLKRGLSGIERCHQLLIVIRSNDLHPMGSQHEGRRKADIAEADNVDHLFLIITLLTIFFAFCSIISLHQVIPKGFQRWGWTVIIRFFGIRPVRSPSITSSVV